MILAEGKLKCLEKSVQQCDLYITRPTWSGLESNPGFLDERPGTNRPRHGTVLLLLLLLLFRHISY